ncbi:MAG: outer membrane lipoprotein carrier protein LolA [Cyclobacteriaceae bacterium]|nr:outer membrane lipoprotein carrier protein LolA [Cyclobacteriaceae bacterium]
MTKKLMFGLVFMCMATLASAQNAKAILDAMSTKYKAIPSFTSNIDYTMVNKADGVNNTFEGSIAVKGDMYSLKMGGQEVINNGITVWTYLPDDNEVNIDNHSAEAGDITPSSIYTIYKNGFTYVLLTPVTVAGKKYDVIDLISTDKEAQFYKIRLEIAQSDKTLGKFTMFDNEGSEFSYTISNFNSKVNLKDSDFVFDEAVHSGVEVIDLR